MACMAIWVRNVRDKLSSSLYEKKLEGLLVVGGPQKLCFGVPICTFSLSHLVYSEGQADRHSSHNL
jgi:hypothetical protein